MKYRVTEEGEANVYEYVTGRWHWRLTHPGTYISGCEPTQEAAQSALDAKLKEIGAVPVEGVG